MLLCIPDEARGNSPGHRYWMRLQAHAKRLEHDAIDGRWPLTRGPEPLGPEPTGNREAGGPRGGRGKGAAEMRGL
eukprot:1318484-Pyramimonas_sp.AAC.1